MRFCCDAFPTVPAVIALTIIGNRDRDRDRERERDKEREREREREKERASEREAHIAREKR